MAINKLNDRRVAAAKPKIGADGKAVSEYGLSDGRGLYLLVRASGSKLWSFLYQSPASGKKKRMGLGPYPQVSLAAAREQVDGLWEVLSRGRDPMDVRAAAREEARAQQAASEATFEKLATQWLTETSQARRWAESTKEKQESRLSKWLMPSLRDRPISTITELEAATLLRGIQAAGRVDTALRVREILRDVFEFSIDLAVPDVPRFMRESKNLGRLVQPERVSYAAITDPTRLGELLRAMRGYVGRGPVVSAALNLLPLLAQRPGQHIAMRWDQLNLDGAEPSWSVPAEQMKMKAALKARLPDFIVPLPQQAVAILRNLRQFTGDREFVFASHRASGKHISEATLGAALRALGYDTRADITPHGFRAVFLTLTQEQFGSGVAVAADRHLAHTPKVTKVDELASASDLGAAYNRAMLTSERRTLVQRWADYLDELAAGPASAASSDENVIQLRTAA